MNSDELLEILGHLMECLSEANKQQLANLGISYTRQQVRTTLTKAMNSIEAQKHIREALARA